MSKSETKLSVEEALAELREMFPLKVERNKYNRSVPDGRTIDIEVRDRLRSTVQGDSARSRATIHIDYATGGFSAPWKVEGETLAECMAQVRKLKASQ